MPFIRLQSFLRRPMIADLEVLDADVAVLGVPTDEARRSSRIAVRTPSDPRAFPAVHGGRPRRLGPPSWASISRTGDGSRAGSPMSATPTPAHEHGGDVRKHQGDQDMLDSTS
jgi:hypothetical protein